MRESMTLPSIATPEQVDRAARAIAREHGTPFYLVEQARFAANIARFRRALQRHHANVIIGYSFKTNYTPSICQMAKGAGCFAEVVSRIELELAQRLAFAHGHVIFNGPLKTLDDIALAIELGAIVNFDHLDQVRALTALPRDALASLRAGLRINIDLNSKLLAQKIAKGGVVPRFGMHGPELQAAKAQLDALGVNVIALHGHCSSSDRSPANYAAISQDLLDTRRSLSLQNVQFVDAGGGFSGRVPTAWNVHDTPSFDDYAQALFAPLLADEWFRRAQPAVVIEPGMAVVADAVNLVTRIISRKTVAGSNLLGVDASFYNVRPTYHTKPLTHRLITQRAGEGFVKEERTGAPITSTTEGTVLAVRAVVGATCMERDILLENTQFVDPAQGDLILIEDVGAYCSVLTPNFIARVPPIIDLSPDGSFKVSRRAQRFEDFFAGFEFEN